MAGAASRQGFQYQRLHSNCARYSLDQLLPNSWKSLPKSLIVSGAAVRKNENAYKSGIAATQRNPVQK
jgi:hypothetical protein